VGGIGVTRLSFIVFSEESDRGSAITRYLEDHGQAQVISKVLTAEGLHEAVSLQQPDALFADLGSAPDTVLDLLDEIPPPRPLLLVAGPQKNPLILRAMRIGAREFLSVKLTPEAVQEAIQRLATQDTIVRPNRLAPTVAVIGSKGGTGATFVTCQLGAVLQKMGHQVGIADLNPALGDVALYFDMNPPYTAANFAHQNDNVDATYLRSILQGHRCGLKVLAAPTQIECVELLSSHHIDRMIALMRAEFDWLLLDLAGNWSDASLRALELADQILLILAFDIPSLKHAREQLALFQRLGIPESKLRSVVNRCARTDPVSDTEFDRFLSRRPDWKIPNDYGAASSALTEGRTLEEIAPRSTIYRSFAKLAFQLHNWCGVELPVTADTTEGLLGRLRELSLLVTERIPLSRRSQNGTS
jgi:pilus assembly protein CpaE